MSHVKMEHPDGRRIVFPFHAEIDPYALKGALQDADVDVSEFLKQISNEPPWDRAEIVTRGVLEV